MPSRSIGDFRLKYKEFNQHELTGTKEYRPPITDFTGPYITHKPDIRVHNIENGDKYIVIASDGLWDEMNLDEVVKLFEANKRVKVDHCEMYE